MKWVWRGKWLIIALAVVGSGSVLLSYWRSPTLYTANAMIEVGKVWGKPLQDLYVTSEIANSPGFIEEAAAKAGIKPNQLGRGTQADVVVTDLPHGRYPILVRIAATTQTEADSGIFAQAVADEIIRRQDKLYDEAMAPHLERQNRLEQWLKEAQAGHDDVKFKLEAELDEVKVNNTSPTSSARTRVVERVVPRISSRPGSLRMVAFAGLIGAMVGVVAACLIGYLRPVLRD